MAEMVRSLGWKPGLFPRKRCGDCAGYQLLPYLPWLVVRGLVRTPLCRMNRLRAWLLVLRASLLVVLMG